MFRPLVVTGQKNYKYNWKTDVEVIAAEFVNYLDTYRPASRTSSKHSRMGPVGKALSKIRAGKGGDALFGEVLRIHEMTSERRKDGEIFGITPEGLAALEKAVTKLTELLEDPKIPLSLHNRIIADVDAAVYYQLEVRHQERIKHNIDQFKQFLINKYHTPEMVLKSWDDPSIIWGKIPYPSAKYNRNPKVAADIQEYLNSTQKVSDSEGEEDQE